MNLLKLRGHVIRSISLRYRWFPHLPASKDVKHTAFIMDHRYVLTHPKSLLNIRTINLIDVPLSMVFSLIVIAGKDTPPKHNKLFCLITGHTHKVVILQFNCFSYSMLNLLNTPPEHNKLICLITVHTHEVVILKCNCFC